MLSPAWPWPATTGGLVRIAGILQQMARQFELTVVAAGTPTDLPPAELDARIIRVPAGARATKRLSALLDPRRPYHVSLYHRRGIAQAIEAELSRHTYDVLYSHFIYGMEYLDGHVPVIVDQQNVDRLYWQNKADLSPFPANVFSAWNTRKTIAYEARALRRVWAYVSVSEEDRERTREYAGASVEHFWVAPNGVDTRRFIPALRPCGVEGQLTLGYLGSMDLQMNIEAVQRFCRELLPRIRQQVPQLDVRLTVIGRAPSAAIRTIAARIPGVTVSGTVPDVTPWLQRVSILVSPLRIGAGTKLKVAEALSCGLPVVGTSLAFAGLPGRAGEHFIRADDDAEFVRAVCELALDATARETMGRRARQLAEAHLDWNAIGDRLAHDIRSALASR